MNNPIPIFHAANGADSDSIEMLGATDIARLQATSSEPDIPQGAKILSLNPETGNLVQSEVTDVMPINPDQVHAVKFSTGRQILVDGQSNTIYGMDVDHPNAGIQQFTLQDARSRRIVVPFAKKISGFPFSGEPITSVSVTDDKDCPFQTLELDFDFGWTLGALAGNGWWDKVDQEFLSNGCWPSKRVINFADLNGESAERLHVFFHDRLCRPGVTPKYEQKLQQKSDHPSRYGDTMKHTYMFPLAETFCDFLTYQLGGERDATTSGAANKHLPPFFLGSPVDFRRGLLCGLVDTDGSCSVSNAKGKPQLLCQYTSTSLRLCNEIVLLCRSLGIEATISFSKKTIAGNTLWLVGMSAVDCKRLNVFQDLANTQKRNAFVQTEVSDKNVSLKFTRVILPKKFANRILQDLTSPKIHKEERDLDTLKVRTKKQLQTVYQLFKKSNKEGIVPRKASHDALAEIRRWTAERLSRIDDALQVLQHEIPNNDFEITPEQVTVIRDGLKAIVPKQDTSERLQERNRYYSYTNQSLKSGRIAPSTVNNLLEWIQSTPVYEDATHDPEVIHWIRHYLNNEDICWASIKSIDPVQDTDEIPAYSMVVPGHGNYMDISGIFIGSASPAVLSTSIPAA